MVYTKKQIGWKHEIRSRKSPSKYRSLQDQHYENKQQLDLQIESVDSKTETQSAKRRGKTKICVERVPVTDLHGNQRYLFFLFFFEF
jgi:hypothetical protein